ncbi:MAG: hypothetical protein C6W54_04705 [Bacillaceae bacterium]|nr:MAG: hypothetical protein C6W54_04705 [Bacillaceae bacterium]
MYLKLCYLLTNKIIKVFINRLFYLSDGIGLKSNIFNPILQILKRYAVFVCLAAYIFWFVLAVLFQILFHHISLPIKTLNLLIILYILQLCIIQAGSGVSDEIRNFAIESRFSADIKKKLIITNEFLGFFLIWLFLLLMSLPFFIVQTYYNSYAGFVFLLQIFSFLFFYGFVLAFIKFLLFVFKRSYPFGSNRFIISFIYLLLCLFINGKKDDLEFFVGSAVRYFIHGDFADFVIKFVPTEVNLYELRIHGWLFWLGIVLIGICLFFFHKACDYLFIEKQIIRSFSKYHLPKKKSLYIFFNYIRSNGIINSHFFVTYTLTVLLFLFVESLPLKVNDISLFTVFLFISLFMNHNHSNIILLCKRHKLSIIQTSVMFSYILWVQYFIVVILLIFAKLISADLAALSFILLGFAFIFSSLIIYCTFIYQFEKYFIDEKAFEKLGGILIVLFFAFVAAIKSLLRLIGLNNLFLGEMLSLICVCTILFLIFHKIDRIRGFFYERFH